MVIPSDITDFIHQTLVDDAGYTQLCIDTVGSKLNFYDSTPNISNEDYYEDLPYLTVTTGASKTDEINMGEDYNKFFTVLMNVSIEYTKTPENKYLSVDKNTATVYEDKNKIHRLMEEAYAILKRESWSCGIKGEDIKAIGNESVVQEIGEDTEELIGSMYIQFARTNELKEEFI